MDPCARVSRRQNERMPEHQGAACHACTGGLQGGPMRGLGSIRAVLLAESFCIGPAKPAWFTDAAQGQPARHSSPSW